MRSPPVILWVRQDLRVSDHRALRAACDSGQPVIPLYVLDDTTPGDWAMGGASRWWLHHSLASLAHSLEARGSRLILRRGVAREVLRNVIDESGATAIYLSRSYEPWAVQLETALKADCDAAGIAIKRFGGTLLKEPEQVRTKTGDVYKVYTPFWRAISASYQLEKPLAAPDAVAAPEIWPESEPLNALGLLPAKPDWASGWRAEWQPGEDGAAARLEHFLSNALKTYSDDRNRPDVAATSRLSPHLHFGEITPAELWRQATAYAARYGGQDMGLETFLKEIVWREFSYYLLFHFPDLPERPFRKDFAGFPWRDDPAALRAWQLGQTGYPIVDAGMRELWATGYMHNRVRMVTASFLVKHMLVPWQVGEAWFWDTLVDADLASNSASWQWVAGSGADAAPYFRIFNPISQGEKFDPQGVYIKRWLPELADLPLKFIHAPWTAPEDILNGSGVRLGATYPLPIVDHAAARVRALDAYAQLKRT